MTEERKPRGLILSLSLEHNLPQLPRGDNRHRFTVHNDALLKRLEAKKLIRTITI